GILVDTALPVQQFDLGNFKIEARLAGNEKIAGGLVIKTGPEEFIVAGKALDVLFMAYNDSLHVAVDAVDAGTFSNGKWVSERRLNGDETHAGTWSGTGLKFPGEHVSIQKISLYRYK
ncbi:MAG TPA: DUF5597 domain-containing protein, partial [Bacteroidales bacterium]|nr:DUF5597 domain-containing protein [Bacteroidales bacterium]